MKKQKIIKGQRFTSKDTPLVATVTRVKRGLIFYTLNNPYESYKDSTETSFSENMFNYFYPERFYTKDHKIKKEEPKLVFRRTYKHPDTGVSLIFLGWTKSGNTAKFKTSETGVVAIFSKRTAETFIQVAKRNSPGGKKGVFRKDEVYRYDKKAGGHIIRMGKQHDVVLTKYKTVPKTFRASLKIGEFEAFKLINNVFLKEALEAVKLHVYPILLAEIGVLKSRNEAGFENQNQLGKGYILEVSSNDPKDGKTTVECTTSNGFSGTTEPKFPAGGTFEPVKPLTWTIEFKNPYKKKSIWSKIKSFFGFGK